MTTDSIADQFRYVETPTRDPRQRAVTAFGRAGEEVWVGVAAIVWDPADDTVASVVVLDIELGDGTRLRRRGVASRLWDEAERRHGSVLTDDGCLTVDGSRFMNGTGRPRAPFVQRVRTGDAMRVAHRNLFPFPIPTGTLDQFEADANTTVG